MLNGAEFILLAVQIMFPMILHWNDRICIISRGLDWITRFTVLYTVIYPRRCFPPPSSFIFHNCTTWLALFPGMKRDGAITARAEHRVCYPGILIKSRVNWGTRSNVQTPRCTECAGNRGKSGGNIFSLIVPFSSLPSSRFLSILYHRSRLNRGYTAAILARKKYRSHPYLWKHPSEIWNKKKERNDT